MPRYTLLKPHFIKNRYISEGAIVEFDGIPSRSMEPVDDEAKSRKQSTDARRPQVGRTRPGTAAYAQQVAAPGGAVPDPHWAPQPRPAFSVLTENVKAGEPRNPEPDMVRVPAGGPTGSVASEDSEFDSHAEGDVRVEPKPAFARGDVATQPLSRQHDTPVITRDNAAIKPSHAAKTPHGKK